MPKSSDAFEGRLDGSTRMFGPGACGSGCCAELPSSSMSIASTCPASAEAADLGGTPVPPPPAAAAAGAAVLTRCSCGGAVASCCSPPTIPDIRLVLPSSDDARISDVGRSDWKSTEYALVSSDPRPRGFSPSSELFRAPAPPCP